ncbi:unnamed protein product [Cyprideis torosa]|uniref:Uncharacterized protein n=1 Tax=Cyprideis torosa TaxID=163714 RepID=A0A7R8WQ19_9CRUS|nr:unnamed protein product [Cyprideis torosa]CAG0907651.1 unnamed protein product [Cyprideis torosa]
MRGLNQPRRKRIPETTAIHSNRSAGDLGVASPSTLIPESHGGKGQLGDFLLTFSQQGRSGMERLLMEPSNNWALLLGGVYLPRRSLPTEGSQEVKKGDNNGRLLNVR